MYCDLQPHTIENFGFIFKSVKTFEVYPRVRSRVKSPMPSKVVSGTRETKNFARFASHTPNSGSDKGAFLLGADV